MFRRHVGATPFHEDDVPKLLGVVGPDSVTFGSDFPHAEGLAAPVCDFPEDLNVGDATTVEKIMRTNLKSLLDRVGT